MSFETLFLYIIGGCFGLMSVSLALGWAVDSYLAYQEFMWARQKELIEIVEVKVEESEDTAG